MSASLRGHVCTQHIHMWGSGWRVSYLEHWTGDRVVLGSNPAGATLLRNFVNSVYHTLPVFSEETLKAGGPFYLVSMPMEVKDPTQGVHV